MVRCPNPSRCRLVGDGRLYVHPFFNTVNLLVGDDDDIKSTSFGRIAYVNTPACRVDVSVDVSF